MTRHSLIVATGPWDADPWRRSFAKSAAGRRVYFWPEDQIGTVPEPYVICTWKADAKVYRTFPKPAAVFSLGAGVDHLAGQPIPNGVPIGRLVSSDLTTRMVEYVAFAVLHLHRRMGSYTEQQRQGVWHPLFQPAAPRVNVGLLGVGVLGAACGTLLRSIGYNVVGWALSQKPGLAFPVLTGGRLEEVLRESDILVSLLPNTPQTRGLVSREVFSKMRRDPAIGGPHFISVGRGECVVQSDLVESLRDGTLKGAVLDVFDAEPLPMISPLWTMDNVLITPHIAADSDPDALAPQIVMDIERLERGERISNPVDLNRGY